MPLSSLAMGSSLSSAIGKNSTSVRWRGKLAVQHGPLIATVGGRRTLAQPLSPA